MSIVFQIAIISFIATFIAGWMLYLLSNLIKKIYFQDKIKEYPGVKQQVAYALLIGVILWISGWLVFLANVKMH